MKYIEHAYSREARGKQLSTLLLSHLKNVVILTRVLCYVVVEMSSLENTQRQQDNVTHGKQKPLKNKSANHVQPTHL